MTKPSKATMMWDIQRPRRQTLYNSAPISPRVIKASIFSVLMQWPRNTMRTSWALQIIRRSRKQPWPDQFTVERWGYLPKSRAGRTTPPLNSPRTLQHMPRWCSCLGELRLREHIWVPPSRHWLRSTQQRGCILSYRLPMEGTPTQATQNCVRKLQWTFWRCCFQVLILGKRAKTIRQWKLVRSGSVICLVARRG